MERLQPERVDTDLLELGDRRLYHPQKVAVSPHGMISTAHYRATDAGVEVMEAGGNAMDAAVAAFDTGSATADEVRASLDRRRRIIVDKLDKAPGLELYSSVGGMFVVVDIRGTGAGSIEFCNGLLDAHNVAILPCDGFGRAGSGLVRISLCARDEVFGEACDRIIRYAGELLSRRPAQNGS